MVSHQLSINNSLLRELSSEDLGRPGGGMLRRPAPLSGANLVPLGEQPPSRNGGPPVFRRPEEALHYLGYRGPGPRCAKCLRRGHLAGQCRGPVCCLECAGEGHVLARCPVRGRRSKTGPRAASFADVVRGLGRKEPKPVASDPRILFADAPPKRLLSAGRERARRSLRAEVLEGDPSVSEILNLLGLEGGDEGGWEVCRLGRASFLMVGPSEQTAAALVSKGYLASGDLILRLREWKGGRGTYPDSRQTVCRLRIRGVPLELVSVEGLRWLLRRFAQVVGEETKLLEAGSVLAVDVTCVVASRRAVPEAVQVVIGGELLAVSVEVLAMPDGGPWPEVEDDASRTARGKASLAASNQSVPAYPDVVADRRGTASGPDPRAADADRRGTASEPDPFRRVNLPVRPEGSAGPRAPDADPVGRGTAHLLRPTPGYGAASSSVSAAHPREATEGPESCRSGMFRLLETQQLVVCEAPKAPSVFPVVCEPAHRLRDIGSRGILPIPSGSVSLLGGPTAVLGGASLTAPPRTVKPPPSALPLPAAERVGGLPEEGNPGGLLTSADDGFTTSASEEPHVPLRRLGEDAGDPVSLPTDVHADGGSEEPPTDGQIVLFQRETAESVDFEGTEKDSDGEQPALKELLARLENLMTGEAKTIAVRAGLSLVGVEKDIKTALSKIHNRWQLSMARDKRARLLGRKSEGVGKLREGMGLEDPSS